MIKDSNSKTKKHKYPDWRHPSLSLIKKNVNFDTENEVIELFKKLNKEYPEISTLEHNRISILIYNRVEPPKKPVQKYILEIKKSKDEKFYVRYSYDNPKNDNKRNENRPRDNFKNNDRNQQGDKNKKFIPSEKKSAVGFYSELAVIDKERKE